MFKTRFRKRLLLVTLTVAAAGLIAAACGTDDGAGGSGIQSISAISQTFTLDDLTAFGFKKSKTYDLEGLTGADAAYFGFWGTDPYDRKDYEVRFYPSHADAVNIGRALADERLVPAKLKKDASSWPQGLKDARLCSGDEASGPASHGIQACTKAKYKAYFIYGNMILLCSGGDEGQAEERCRKLLGQFTNPA